MKAEMDLKGMFTLLAHTEPVTGYITQQIWNPNCQPYQLHLVITIIATSKYTENNHRSGRL